MSAKGLFADTLSGVGPDPNAPVQPKNAEPTAPLSSVVSTWRGSGEHLVVHVDQPELSSLISTQRGSGAYAALTSIDYHSPISATQTLPLGTRVDVEASLERRREAPPVTPRLSTLPSAPVAAVAPHAHAPSPANESLPPNVVSLPATNPTRRSSRWRSLALAAVLLSAGALLVPVPSHPSVSLVPTLAVEPLSIHAHTPGTVGKVHVKLGDTVRAEQVLVSLDENERLRQAERMRLRIDQLESELEQLVSKDQRLHQAALGALRQKRAVIVSRLAQYTDAPANGNPSPSQSVSARSDAELQLRQQLADIDFLRHDRQRSFDQRKRSTEALLSEAHAELLQVNSVNLTARATVGARVSRLLVQPGNAVNPGTALVELTPLDAATKLVGFIPEDAAVRINPRDAATVALSTVAPHATRTVYAAHVTHVAHTAASSEEVQYVLGSTPNEALRRVELSWPESEHTTLASLVDADPTLRVTGTFAAFNETLGVHLWRTATHLLRAY